MTPQGTRTRIPSRRAAPVVAALALLVSDFAAAQVGPTGFEVTNAFPGAVFTVPVQVVFLPDGRKLVVEKAGIVWLMTPTGTQLPTPFIDLSVEVRGSIGDLGLLGVAIDPDYATTPWVYLSYTVDPNGDGSDGEAHAFARVTRYRASATNPNVADLSTRQVLVGASWPAGIASMSLSHTIGTLRFGQDKTLFIGAGDGAHFEYMDAGGHDDTGFGSGRTSEAEDMGAFRSSSLNTLAGKILRVDKETGLGLSSNPYWNGFATSVRSRVWLYGLRNPFRFCFRPGSGVTDPSAGDPGTLYVGEVGWYTYEELDIAPSGGMNFGWPCIEGPGPMGEYQGAGSVASGDTAVICSAPLNPEDPTPPTGPALHWHHSDPFSSNPVGWTGTSSTGGTFYTGVSYPEEFRGKYFQADYTGGWIRVVSIDEFDGVTGTADFIQDGDGPVDIEADPFTKDLYYVAIFAREVRRIRYVPVDVEPAVAPRPVLASSARPNPFRTDTTIDFALDREARTTLDIYDSAGRWVRSLANQRFGTGPHTIPWDGRDGFGRDLVPGVYYYRLGAEQTATSTSKITRLP